MDAQTLADELNHPDAQEMLRSAPMARLAYNGTDGLPRVIPCGFYWNGEQIVVCTATTSPKVRALSARPHVAVTVDTGATPADAKAVLVRGVAELDTVEGVPDEYLKGSTKALEGVDHEEFEQNVRSMYDQMVRIRIKPLWARFFDFGAGRLPQFLAEMAQDT
jgi:nitroimidazol reductase NimA-like FMN-containing flavoprotein (pyridoxamine 5'-phosphate oxidase superfamily)